MMAGPTNGSCHSSHAMPTTFTGPKRKAGTSNQGCRMAHAMPTPTDTTSQCQISGTEASLSITSANAGLESNSHDNVKRRDALRDRWPIFRRRLLSTTLGPPSHYATTGANHQVRL